MTLRLLSGGLEALLWQLRHPAGDGRLPFKDRLAAVHAQQDRRVQLEHLPVVDASSTMKLAGFPTSMPYSTPRFRAGLVVTKSRHRSRYSIACARHAGPCRGSAGGCRLRSGTTGPRSSLARSPHGQAPFGDNAHGRHAPGHRCTESMALRLKNATSKVRQSTLDLPGLELLG